jgi:hypothetical protein
MTGDLTCREETAIRLSKFVTKIFAVYLGKIRTSISGKYQHMTSSNSQAGPCNPLYRFPCPSSNSYISSKIKIQAVPLFTVRNYPWSPIPFKLDRHNALFGSSGAILAQSTVWITFAGRTVQRRIFALIPFATVCPKKLYPSRYPKRRVTPLTFSPHSGYTTFQDAKPLVPLKPELALASTSTSTSVLLFFVEFIRRDVQFSGYSMAVGQFGCSPRRYCTPNVSTHTVPFLTT